MTTHSPRLQVLIATYGRRIEAINPADLPEVDGVEYVVTCQNPDGLALDTSRLDCREDVCIYYFADKGVSRNRNHGLDVATAEYILISDDDITYNGPALTELISTFDADDDIDIVTTRSITPEPHVYPLDRHNLDKPCRFYSPIAFEIALRRSSLLRTGVRFDENISIGTDYITCGEENFFFRKCLNSDLGGIYRNITVSTHHGPTTSSSRAGEAGVIRAKGAFMPYERGCFNALVRLPVEAWRSPVTFYKAMWYLAQGYCYYLRHRCEL